MMRFFNPEEKDGLGEFFLVWNVRGGPGLGRIKLYCHSEAQALSACCALRPLWLGGAASTPRLSWLPFQRARGQEGG